MSLSSYGMCQKIVRCRSSVGGVGAAEASMEGKNPACRESLMRQRISLALDVCAHLYDQRISLVLVSCALMNDSLCGFCDLEFS